MAKIFVVAAIITLMLVTLFQSVSTRPTARRDLIDGSEFLSLFINNAMKGSASGDYANFDVDDNKSKDKDENQFLDPTTEKIPFREDQTQSTADPLLSTQNSQESDEEQSTNLNSISTTIRNILRHHTQQSVSKNSGERKEIIQIVTSGSKVVFLEELTPFDGIQADQNSNDVFGEVKNVENSTKNNTSSEIADQDASESEIDVTEIDTAVLLDNIGHFDEDGVGVRDFISHAHKTELTVDDSDPVMRGISESVSSESHEKQHLNHDSQSSSNRKSIVPIQTVIYHDNYHKSMSAQPRSVSYSSITQSIDQPHSWPNSDVYQEAKKNVSEGLNPKTFQEPTKVYNEPAAIYGEPEKVYSEPSKVYSEPAKVYSEPEKVYGKPAKVYSQPAQVYGEPAKFYSEPAKVYSEPAKVYSEPAKVYSEPSKTYWPMPVTTSLPTLSTTSTMTTTSKQTTQRKVIYNLDKLPYDLLNAPGSNNKLLDVNSNHHSSSLRRNFTAKHLEEDDGSYRPEHHHGHLMVTQRPSYRPTHYTESSENIYTPTPEQNYEVEESVSVKTNGRAHGIQPASPSTVNPKEDAKVGYVFEGRNYRKYRVEEKTPDGFIVGEYGVVSHNDGSLRGVRYTADSNINPSLIHDALMKFLSL